MEQIQKRNKKKIQPLLAVLVALVVVVLVSVVVFLRFYDSYIDGVLYRERLSQMQEVTTQLFSGLEDVVRNQWENVDTFINYVELGKPGDTGTLLTFMRKQTNLNNMDASGEVLVAIDEKGRYVTQEGWQGTLEEMNLLLDNPERLNFVSKSLTSNQTYMYFLNRLKEPIPMEDAGETTRLLYYGVAKDMTRLNAYFTCEAYNNSNSVYVLNQQGARLFRSGSNPVEGYNAYAVLQEADYLHGHSFENAKADLEAKGYGYANAILDGEEYYFALYQMDNADWILLFLVPSAHVATNVVSMVNTTVKLILVFAVAMIAVSAVLIFIFAYYQQKKAVDAERRNSERLSEALATAEHAEQVAKEASRAKSDFLSNMSHDIRTPMNAIVGITRLMAHDKSDPEKLDAYIHKVQQSSQHLLSLINDVLDMSKIESSDVRLNQEPIDLADQIGQVESILRPQIAERGQHFTVGIRNITHEHLIGDGVRTRQILINLLSNAVKYTPNGGEISLEIEELPQKKTGFANFSIRVTDNGYGMTPEFVEHIFEPFVRAENSTTNRVQGTGLGMAITKSIVDLAGGTIRVESEVNRGSRFTVELPFRIDTEVRTVLPVAEILLITDDPELAENTRAAFRESETSLFVATSKEQADEILEKNHVEALLLGSTLGSKHLEEEIDNIREKTGNLPLICCCNYDERERLPELGKKADAVLARPIFLSGLAAALERAQKREPVQAEEGTSVLKGMNFLCAEDNALNAEILEAVLDMNGASCRIYPNGREIVQAFASVQPGEYDAILMDVQMPVMNGLDATRAIRNGDNPLGKTIPIIAMTANAFSEDVQNCLNAGMDAHISKPLDMTILERTVKAVTGGNFSGGGGQLSAHKRRSR